jgi:glycosyltransferase involved in cell wall biosynthesis
VSAAIAIYARGEPALCWLFAALARMHELCGVSPTGAVDIARLAVGRGRFDPLAPRTVPHSLLGEGFYRAAMRRLTRDAATVILTRPDQAALLPLLPASRKIYIAIDDYDAYGRSQRQDEAMLVAAADHVVAVSTALAIALRDRYGISRDRLTVSPNGVPMAWIPAQCPAGAASLPAGLNLPRPLAGVIGRISSRLRLDWLVDAVERLPWLHWLFVGDVEAEELLPEDRPQLQRLRASPRCRFIGQRAYEALPAFAAALDVAVMPYSERSTNPHGSPVRLFLQLPFGTAIVATPGCRQVEEFSSLLRMCPTSDGMIAALEELRRQGFDDGLRQARWQAAKANSWEARARVLAPLIWPAAARSAEAVAFD